MVLRITTVIVLGIIFLLIGLLFLVGPGIGGITFSLIHNEDHGVFAGLITTLIGGMIGSIGLHFLGVL